MNAVHVRSTTSASAFGVHLLRARNQAWSYGNSVVALEAIEHFLELLAEPRDVIGDHSADDVDVDIEICVGEYHSRPDDVAPCDPGWAFLVASEILEAASPRISIHRFAAA